MGNGQLPGVRERQERARGAQSRKSLSRASVELQTRRTMAADDFDAGPEDALRVSGAKRLHCRLFRGEASGERRREVAFAAAISNLSLGEHPSKGATAVPTDCLTDAIDLRRIESRSYNVHRVWSILHEPAAGLRRFRVDGRVLGHRAAL